MPMYTLRCSRCDHSKERGFTVAALKAQESQRFAFIVCPMCSRRGTMSHDFMADARSQVIQKDEYTFAANAPEENLVGRTVTRAEAAAVLKKHGLVNAGKSAKGRSSSQVRSETQAEIVARWEEKATSAGKSSKNKEVAIETSVSVTDTITSKPWPALKAQAKLLGIKVANTIKRPELERLVRDQLTT